MTVAEAILRGVCLTLGVGLAALLLWLSYKSDEDVAWGCLPILIGLLALTLIIGGVAGPEAAGAFWNGTRS